MIPGFLHHIHRRKIQHKELQPYPHSDPRIRLLDRTIMMVAAFGPMANIPQIIRIYSSHDAGGLSFTTWFLFAIMNLVWILYGTVHKEKMIMIGSISAAIFHIPILVGVLIY